MAGMPVCLYMSLTFMKHLAQQWLSVHLPTVIWQPKFLAGMWKIPCHSQSVDEMMGWIREREEQKILKQHDAMR